MGELADMRGFISFSGFLALNVFCDCTILSLERKVALDGPWKTNNCAMLFGYAVNGWNHVTAASHVLSHCSYLVEDNWSCEATNSALGRLGDVMFSLVVSPDLPFSWLFTFSPLSDTGAWCVAMVRHLLLPNNLCSPSYVFSDDNEMLYGSTLCLYNLLLYGWKGWGVSTTPKSWPRSFATL